MLLLNVNLDERDTHNIRVNGIQMRTSQSQSHYGKRLIPRAAAISTIAIQFGGVKVLQSLIFADDGLQLWTRNVSDPVCKSVA